jgi:hypothetical protein
MIRWGLAVYCTAIACLIALLSPGAWRWGAVVPLLAIAGFWRLLEPHTGTHAGGPAFASPDAGPPMGPMIPDEEHAWRQRYQVPPLNEGGWNSGACADGPREERWPAHDDPYWPLDPGTGGDPPGRVPPLLDVSSQPPVPAEGSGPPAPDTPGGLEPEDWTPAELRALHDAAHGARRPRGSAPSTTPPTALDEPPGAGMVAGEIPAQSHETHETPAPGSGERMASTMEQEILSPLILDCLDYSRAMADDCAAFMQHAAVAWAAMGSRGAR